MVVSRTASKLVMPSRPTILDDDEVIKLWAVLIGEFFFSRFSRYIVNFVSRYGGVLSQFVNFDSPGKSRTVSIRVSIFGGKIRKAWGGGIRGKKKTEKSTSLGQKTFR